MILGRSWNGELPQRWTKLRPHPVQQAYFKSEARIIVVPAGRRSGKTEIAKRKQVIRGIRETEWEDARFGFCAPTWRQAKKIFWNDLKRLVPHSLRDGKPNETECEIKLYNGALLCVVSLDVPERIEGFPWNGLHIDEIANAPPRAWQENILPAISDRKAKVILTGVPEGRNHYYDIYCAAKADTTGTYEVFEWSAEEILDPGEIKILRDNLDPKTFEQEVQGKFVDFSGDAYYAFTRAGSVRDFWKYDPKLPLIFAFDFNVSPGVAVIIQESEDGSRAFVIDEVYIEQHSNTPMVCNILLDRYRDHKAIVKGYGDSTGGASGTAKVHGSDIEIIGKMLRTRFQYVNCFGTSNPPERARVNAVNTALFSGRLTIASKCKSLIRDMEGVKLVKGGDGSIDKKTDKRLTHISDALGYYVHKRYGILPQTRPTSEEV